MDEEDDGGGGFVGDIDAAGEADALVGIEDRDGGGGGREDTGAEGGIGEREKEREIPMETRGPRRWG